MATMPANTTMRTLYSRMRFDTRTTGAMVGIRLRGALGSTMTLVHNSVQNKLNTAALDEENPAPRHPNLFFGPKWGDTDLTAPPDARKAMAISARAVANWS